MNKGPNFLYTPDRIMFIVPVARSVFKPIKGNDAIKVNGRDFLQITNYIATVCHCGNNYFVYFRYLKEKIFYTACGNFVLAMPWLMTHIPWFVTIFAEWCGISALLFCRIWHHLTNAYGKTNRI